MKLKKLPKKPKASASLKSIEGYLQRVKDTQKANCQRKADQKKKAELLKKVSLIKSNC